MNCRALLAQGGEGPSDRACRALDNRRTRGVSQNKGSKIWEGGLPLMSRKRQPNTEQQTPARKPTPTFLLELPLQVTPGQAKRVRAHLEAARQLYRSEAHTPELQ